MNPPIVGPIVGAISTGTATNTDADARSSGRNTLKTIEVASGNKAPPPTPWMIRNAISSGRPRSSPQDSANPQSRLPTVKIPKKNRYIRF